jgi:flagellar biosynthesis activator protein FlaF
MSISDPARSGYAAQSIRTDRGSEYAIFARVTHRLSAVDESDRSAYSALAQAVSENSRLWGALADDLMHDDNMLPVELRARLVSIAEFVRRHSHAVLSGRDSVRPLIDINTAIMRGLRGVGVEEAA